jgi:hypothetical protein
LFVEHAGTLFFDVHCETKSRFVTSTLEKSM